MNNNLRFRLPHFFLILTSVFPNLLYSQSEVESPFKVSAYLESFYSYDFSNPDDGNRPSFLFNFNRHNEFAPNLALVQLDYDEDRVRGRISLMAGTYANANLAAEPGVLRNIFEAYTGYKLSKDKNIWLDVGVFESHLGFESAVGSRNINLSRSLAAEGSPYYLSGAKVTYTNDNETLMLSGVITNGWQRMQREVGNKFFAGGHQIFWKPSEKLSLNSSSYIGGAPGYTNFAPTANDGDFVLRYFHNFYAQYEVSPIFSLIAGFDYGTQENSQPEEAEEYVSWSVFTLVAQATLNDKMRAGLRYEYFNDPNQVIVYGVPGGSLQLSGYSLNLDYSLSQNMLFRVEGRYFSSSNPIFLDNEESNFALTSSISLSF